MGTFTTPYDTLLRVRRIEEDKAKARLARANAARRAASERLDGARDHYADATGGSHAETQVQDFTRRHAREQAAADSVVRAGQDLEKADGARASAVTAVTAAAMRTQGLERLVDRAREEHLAEVLADDQRSAEESMTGRATRARKKGAR